MFPACKILSTSIEQIFGVPQGSVLFIMYSTQISYILFKSNYIKHQLYANERQADQTRFLLIHKNVISIQFSIDRYYVPISNTIFCAPFQNLGVLFDFNIVCSPQFHSQNLLLPHAQIQKHSQNTGPGYCYLTFDILKVNAIVGSRIHYCISVLFVVKSAKFSSMHPKLVTKYTTIAKLMGNQHFLAVHSYTSVLRSTSSSLGPTALFKKLP